MASNQLDYLDKIDFSVFGDELVMLTPHAEDVYGSLRNNGLHVFQPNCQMDLSVVKAVLSCYFKTVRSVYIQSPQVHTLISALARSSPVQDFKSSFTTGSTEHLSQRILCKTVM